MKCFDATVMPKTHRAVKSANKKSLGKLDKNVLIITWPKIF